VDDQTVLAGSQPQASLVVSQGAQVGTTFSITGSEVILGREEGIGIAVPDPEVSRQHARVVWQGGYYYLEDLGSTNGTFLNGTPVTGAQILRAGDSIGIGQTLLVFQTQPGAIPAEAVAAPAAAYPTQAPPPAPAPAPVADNNADLQFLGLTNPEDLEKFHRPLEYIEGIGPVYAGKLSAIGVQTPLNLLRDGATPQGRSDIAKRSEISGLLILEWINHIDLYRIKGVGSEYADLLEESGVDTVMELAHRNAQNLFEKMSSVNDLKQLVRKLPAQNQVEDWVEQAKSLPRVIQY